MEAHSLEYWHNHLNKNIKLASAYTEVKELEFIIKFCRLIPKDFSLLKKDKQIKLHRWWVDEFGNSLKIIKNKRIKIIYNDLSVTDNVNTDLYYGLSMDKIYKISKLVFIYCGKDDMDQYYIYVSFLGIDNYLRTFVYEDNQFKLTSALFLGLKNLKFIGKHLDIKYYLNLKNKENIIYPCVLGEGWLSLCPVSDDLKTIIDRQLPQLTEIFL